MLALYGWGLKADLGGGAPAALLDRLASRGLPFAQAADGPRFDPAETVNRVIAEGLAGREPAWRDRFVATGRALAGWPASTPRRFRIRFTRRFALSPLAGRAGVRLRLPRPIAADMILALSAPGCTVTQAPGRIELRPAGGAPPWLEAGWTADIASDPAAIDATPLSAQDRARWLAPVEGLVQVTPPVRALAAALAGTIADDRAAVAAFRAHLIDRFACGILAYEAIAGPATDHVLACGWYDCQLGAALLVALCRARGVPARLVGGYLLWSRPSRHMWCEVWLDGWRPFDLLAWDLSAGGSDAGWRDIFAGTVDHRLRTEVLPDIFTGPMSLALPAAHHRIARAVADGGVEIDHCGLDGDSIYRDRISVTAPDRAPA
ncbi:transglutaminase-like domain-containing protein [Sphingomonas profundi]|uniref:transglutaminase-like domain-containing protein n=1 Tax=Alterirhizorhabdus profundi TaxID=2681549 RepID=UPI001E3DC23F|nr:transglutaminase-like domain-containing protein [Sphingomonas profundi]